MRASTCAAAVVYTQLLASFPHTWCGINIYNIIIVPTTTTKKAINVSTVDPQNTSRSNKRQQ